MGGKGWGDGLLRLYYHILFPSIFASYLLLTDTFMFRIVIFFFAVLNIL